MARKKIIFVWLFILLFCGILYAARLLTEKQAMKEMFPESDKIITETKKFTEEEIVEIKERLGGSLLYYNKKSDSEKISENVEYTFYYGMKDGVKMGVALIERQPGKWGPVEYVISLDVNSAKVQNMAVMSYKEKRGRPIARKNFLRQFFGKGSDDPIKIRKDIRGISGATISSEATCFAVKKAIAIVEVILNKAVISSTVGKQKSEKN